MLGLAGRPPIVADDEWLMKPPPPATAAIKQTNVQTIDGDRRKQTNVNIEQAQK